MNIDYSKTIERVYQLFRTCPDPNRKESAEGWSVAECFKLKNSPQKRLTE